MLVSRAKRELTVTGLIGKQEISDASVQRIRRCYPIYRLNYRKEVDCISKYLGTIQGLSVIGRYGSFKYNNQDHSILMGILASENILQHAKHDLWGVNTDYESYQEETPRVSRSETLLPHSHGSPCG
jgi:hypothetical protein